MAGNHIYGVQLTERLFSIFFKNVSVYYYLMLTKSLTLDVVLGALVKRFSYFFSRIIDSLSSRPPPPPSFLTEFF